jgi:hypothetical protein
MLKMSVMEHLQQGFYRFTAAIQIERRNAMFKSPVRIEMNDLDDEKESLANFLQKHFKLKSLEDRYGLEVNGEEVSTYELQRMVNKFVNSKGLNRTHWVKVEGNVVKLNMFNKQKKEKKNKHPQTAATIKHGW